MSTPTTLIYLKRAEALGPTILTSLLALATSAIMEMTRVRLAPGGAGPMTLPLIDIVVGAVGALVGAGAACVTGVVALDIAGAGVGVDATLGLMLTLALALALALGAGFEVVVPDEAGVDPDVAVGAGGLTGPPLLVAEEVAGGRTDPPWVETGRLRGGRVAFPTGPLGRTFWP